MLVLIGCIWSLMYFCAIPEKQYRRARWYYWRWYFVALGVYVFLCIIVLLLVVFIPRWKMAQRTKLRAKLLRSAILERMTALRTNPSCQSPQETCREKAIALKRANDAKRLKLNTDDINALETKIQRDPTNPVLKQQLKDMRRAIAEDVQRIDKCDKLPQTNACINDLIERCDDMVQTQSAAQKDPAMLENFRRARSKEAPSVLIPMCRNIALYSP